MNNQDSIGFLKGGSIGEGFTIRLLSDVKLEEVRLGDFVVVQGKIYRFFGIVDDLKLLSYNEDVFFDPPDTPLKEFAIKGNITFSEASVSSYLMVDSGGHLFSIKTMPEHFSCVRKATQEDLELVFGKNVKKPFFVGMPLTMDEHIYLDLDKLCMRNNAIFGITGSGKTVLAKIIFAGIIKENVSSLLIFDMHNEYGRNSRGEEGVTPALKTFFPERVKVFDVSVENRDADQYVTIPLKYIEPEDLSLLSTILSYSERSEETALIVGRIKGREWLKYLFSLQDAGEEKRQEEAQILGVNPNSLSALVRHTQRLRRLRFLEDTEEESSIDMMLNCLKSGVSVVVQFSGMYYNDPLCYFLVSNVISRRIHRRYEDLEEEEREKRRIVIVVEEAHKFLSTESKEGNIFGIIAREMRKFNVTLFIIDQRPSEIDPDVLSQVGTRFTLQLLDEKDIDAVFQGVSGGARLRKILRSIEHREALLFGYALPMPVAIKVREFGEELFSEMQKPSKGSSPIDDLYG